MSPPEVKDGETLQANVLSTTDGRGMVYFALAGLVTPAHAIELSKMLLDEAVKATEDKKREP